MVDLSDPTFWIPTIIPVIAIILTYVDMRRRYAQDRAASKAALDFISKHRDKAYVRLYGILERFGVNASTTRLFLSTSNYKELENAVEDNYEVLYQSTIDEWRNKKVFAGGNQQIAIDAGTFFGDILDHYARLDKRNPYHALDKDPTL